MREREQPGPRADLGQDRLERLRGRAPVQVGDANASRRDRERADQAEVLRIGCDDLVAGLEAETRDDDPAPRHRGVRERHAPRLGTHQRRELAAHLVAEREHALEVRLSAAPVLRLPLLLGRHRGRRRTRDRPERARVQVGVASQHREAGADVLERAHPTSRSTGA